VYFFNLYIRDLEVKEKKQKKVKIVVDVAKTWGYSLIINTGEPNHRRLKMTNTYTIEKKTPNSNWYTIHSDLDANTAIAMLADIIFAYDSMAEDFGDYADTKEMFATELAADGYVSTSVDDGENGERGDNIGYRIVMEA
jgi:hypothetical protein